MSCYCSHCDPSPPNITTDLSGDVFYTDKVTICERCGGFAWIYVKRPHYVSVTTGSSEAPPDGMQPLEGFPVP